MKKLHKALLIPVNSKSEIFIQDRRGHKPPDWGFFGGGIEEGETPVEAVIREAGEELTVTIRTSELIDVGEFYTEYEDEQIWRQMFLYQTEGADFDVREGKGGAWLSKEEASVRLHQAEYFDTLWAAIQKVLG